MTSDLSDGNPHSIAMDVSWDGSGTATARFYVDGSKFQTSTFSDDRGGWADPAIVVGDRSGVAQDSFGLFARNRGGATDQEVADLHSWMVDGLADGGTSI